MKHAEHQHCRTCGRERLLVLVDRNDVGRPIWWCQACGETQAGPFAEEATVAPTAELPEPVLEETISE